MNEPLYRAAIAADDAWQVALVACYGKRAGDARYDARGESTPELRGLKQAKIAADAALHAAVDAETTPCPDCRGSAATPPALYGPWPAPVGTPLPVASCARCADSPYDWGIVARVDAP